MQSYGVVRTALPTRQADAVQAEVRLGPYAEHYGISIGAGFYGPAAEGSYLKAVNPTFATAFAPSIAAATGFVETAASICLRNTGGAGAKDIYLDYIRLLYVTAPTGNTALQCVMQMDNANRYTSGGAAATVVNMNNGVANTTVADLRVGALVTTAASASRKLGFYTLKAAIPAINDEFLFNFGGVDTVATAPGVAKAMGPGPVYLPAGSNHSFLLHLFGAAQSAAGTVHLDMGWIER